MKFKLYKRTIRIFSSHELDLINNKLFFLPILFGFTLLMALSSCKKFVDIADPKDRINSERAFADSANATSSILGLYITSRSNSPNPNISNGGLSIYLGMSADELAPTYQWSSDVNELYQNSLQRLNGLATVFWHHYSVLYQANACIEGLEKSAIKESVKNQLMGEAKFFRAWNYFLLVNIFGKVPLVTTTNYQTNATLPRASEDNVYLQILQDLNDCENLLQSNYVSSGRVRVNKFAAKALLARVLLYRGRFAEAEVAATDIINSALYQLTSDLNNVFTSNSQEAIWQLLSAGLNDGLATTEGFAFVPYFPGMVPNYAIMDTLLKSFEPNDNRYAKWVAKTTVTVGSTPIDYYYPYKYKEAITSSTPIENIMVFRLAEQYLIRAEARAKLDKLTGANSAQSDINVIRGRAGLPSTIASTKDELLTAIGHERKIEFFAEGGHRWFDLKRTNRLDQIMSGITPLKGGTWNTNQKLFPVPLVEIQKNPFLDQNPGY